jgi:hypothetical protein
VFYCFLHYPLQRILYTHALILRACKCIKSETRELPIFSLKIGSSVARGSSPYEPAWYNIVSGLI